MRWATLVQQNLRAQFPETDFSFQVSGVSGKGSRAHAHRFYNDVLRFGIPDVLFIEAAVIAHVLSHDTTAF